MSLTKKDVQIITEIVEQGVSGLKEDVGELKDNVSVLQEDVTKIQVVQLEGRVIPCLNEIVEYQKSTYDRYNIQSDMFEDKISLLDTTVQEVKKHSEQIRELQLKQA